MVVVFADAKSANCSTNGHPVFLRPAVYLPARRLCEDISKLGLELVYFVYTSTLNSGT